jgi:hypothetical protein
MTKYVFILIGMFALIGLVFVGCGGGGGGSPTEPNPTPTPNTNIFTGTFRVEHAVPQPDGTTINVVDLLTLTQNGNTITGTRSATETHTCCNTASYSIPVTGTADGTNATLTWGAVEGRCDGANGCWVTVNTDGGTFNVTLSDDGRTLRFIINAIEEDWTRQ